MLFCRYCCILMSYHCISSMPVMIMCVCVCFYCRHCTHDKTIVAVFTDFCNPDLFSCFASFAMITVAKSHTNKMGNLICNKHKLGHFLFLHFLFSCSNQFNVWQILWKQCNIPVCLFVCTCVSSYSPVHMKVGRNLCLPSSRIQEVRSFLCTEFFIQS